MSNRSSQYVRENQRGYQPKTQRKFVPKAANSASKPHQTLDPNLSTSLRQSLSPGAEAVASSAASGSRVRLSDNGEWVSNRVQGDGSFVNYLPQDEAVAVGLGVEEGGLDPVESQRVVDLLNRELSRLLKLKPREFWREVAKDASLHDFLNSFLQFRSRWYDFPYHGSRETVAGVIIGDTELSRRVFMVLYRISSHKDPGAQVADRLSSRDHEVLLQEKSLLDLPKLLDICAIYGHDNEELTKTLVVNSVKAQPGIHLKFGEMVSHFLDIAWTMYQRCSSSLEVLISAGKSEDQFNQRKIDYLEVMDFLNDGISELDAFLIAYKPAAVYFCSTVEIRSSHGNEEIIVFLARLHDSLLPMLQQGLRIILAAKENNVGTISSSSPTHAHLSLKILSKRIVHFGGKLLDLCYLSDDIFEDELPLPTGAKIFPAKVEDPILRAEILIQTFKEVAGVPQHDQGNNYTGTFLHNIEKDFQVMHRIESLQNSGWILIDEEQLQYLAKIMRHPLMSTEPKSLPHAPTAERSGNADEDSVIMESKISQIRDLFPDYGKGFLSACLEVYNHNPEEVIQRILEGTLHQDLQALDPSMEICPPKPKPLPLPSQGRKDKGKAVLVDSEPSSVSLHREQSSKAVPPLGSSTSSSLFGRFVRKPNDTTRLDQDVFNLRDEKHLERTQALLSQYEYEDEYDDSFDDLGMSAVDSGFEETENLGDRFSSRIGVSTTRDSDSAAAPSASSKWGSRKKPQFYVKDGKNYSYKVEGSVAVANYNEASLVNEAQKEMIHGLGRGGNLPMGAVQKLEENIREEGGNNDRSDAGSEGAQRGRGRGRGRGGGRRGGGGGNHYRKDRAMKKHMSGVGGF